MVDEGDTHTAEKEKKAETDGSRDSEAQAPRGGGWGRAPATSQSISEALQLWDFWRVKQVCVYPGQTQRAPGFLPRGRVGSPTQALLFQTRNFSLVSQEPESPGPEVSCSECLPSFHEAVCRWGSLLETHLGQRGGAGKEQTDQGPEKSSTLKIAFPLSGEEPRIPGAASGCDLPNRPRISHGKRDSGAGSGGVERLLGSREGAG